MAAAQRHRLLGLYVDRLIHPVTRREIKLQLAVLEHELVAAELLLHRRPRQDRTAWSVWLDPRRHGERVLGTETIDRAAFHKALPVEAVFSLG